MFIDPTLWAIDTDFVASMIINARARARVCGHPRLRHIVDRRCFDFKAMRRDWKVRRMVFCARAGGDPATQ